MMPFRDGVRLGGNGQPMVTTKKCQCHCHRDPEEYHQPFPDAVIARVCGPCADEMFAPWTSLVDSFLT